MKKPKVKSLKKPDLKIISLAKKIKLPKEKILKIKFNKVIALKILAGIIFFFASQLILSFVMIATLSNLYQKGVDIQTPAMIFNLTQYLLIAATGSVVGWLTHENVLVWGVICGLVVSILFFAFGFLPGNPVPIGIPERLVNLFVNGIFLAVLMAAGAKAGQVFYLKKHPENI